MYAFIATIAMYVFMYMLCDFIEIIFDITI